jgi:hypothetical protein
MMCAVVVVVVVVVTFFVVLVIGVLIHSTAYFAMNWRHYFLWCNPI